MVADAEICQVNGPLKVSPCLGRTCKIMLVFDVVAQDLFMFGNPRGSNVCLLQNHVVLGPLVILAISQVGD